MEIRDLLIPLSLILVFAIGALFGWAVTRGRFDEGEGPAHRILMDEDRQRRCCAPPAPLDARRPQ